MGIKGKQDCKELQFPRQQKIDIADILQYALKKFTMIIFLITYTQRNKKKSYFF